MPLEARDAAYLWDMREAARGILRFIAGETLAAFAAKEMLRYAVERQFIVIGEAARRVSGACKEAHPEVAWREVIALRNVLTHEYGEIAVERVWLTATEDLPKLLAQLESLVPPADDEC